MKNTVKKFYTAMELIEESGARIGKKMFDYLRYFLRLFPEPIKFSNGRGIIALYPDFVLAYFKLILRERKKGASFKAIREILAKEREEVFALCDYVRRQVKLEREIGGKVNAQLRDRLFPQKAVSGRPKDLEIKVHENIAVESSVEVKIEELKKELKDDFISWDGQTVDKLSSIRRKIDNLETLESRSRVLETIKLVI